MYGNARFAPGIAGAPVLATTGAPAVVWLAAAAVFAVGTGMLVLRSRRIAESVEASS